MLCAPIQQGTVSTGDRAPSTQPCSRRRGAPSRPTIIHQVRVYAVIPAQVDEARLASVGVEAAFALAVVAADPVGVVAGADHQYRALAVRCTAGGTERHQVGQLPIAPLGVMILGDGAAVGPFFQVG